MEGQDHVIMGLRAVAEMPWMLWSSYATAADGWSWLTSTLLRSSSITTVSAAFILRALQNSCTLSAFEYYMYFMHFMHFMSHFIYVKLQLALLVGKLFANIFGQRWRGAAALDWGIELPKSVVKLEAWSTSSKDFSALNHHTFLALLSFYLVDTPKRAKSFWCLWWCGDCERKEPQVTCVTCER